MITHNLDNEEEKSEQEEQIEFDNHEIRNDWNKLKEIVKDVESDMDRVLQRKGVNASVRARNKLSAIKRLCLRIRQGIRFQRQDNKSDYDCDYDDY